MKIFDRKTLHIDRCGFELLLAQLMWRTRLLIAVDGVGGHEGRRKLCDPLEIKSLDDKRDLVLG